MSEPAAGLIEGDRWYVRRSEHGSVMNNLGVKF